eukprot:TRINITY_DN5608_c0_g1_i1.p1 TRINITY_DN5608_c0_g1~~TRINITY_DN5608_c0_g1_i1.p1  ORF type:complete len:562 (+),score=192.32 TRINITY_DN5608_c0_g1_i1:47-1732(+)
MKRKKKSKELMDPGVSATSSSLSSTCSSSEEQEEEVETGRPKLRARKSDDLSVRVLQRERGLLRRLSRIYKKSPETRSESEISLFQSHPELLEVVSSRASKRETLISRKEEVEDPPQILQKKIQRLSDAIQRSKALVAYTGAGISTSANIPDYRGPNGVWTRLEKGLDIGEYTLEASSPTPTHMALFSLFKRGKLKHIVSQNCDGLHLRSGIPRHSLSELHGNMFIEICKRCRPMRPFVRLFDVTERTSKNRHATRRRCYVCGHSLVDTIVHFGERGSLKWPLNWEGASKAAEKADVILCLGSSLKVLRRYPWLWCMDKPKRERPQLFIVNLQWTPKDKHATLKLNGRCDDVMKRVFELLGHDLPAYYPLNDPLLSFGTRLNPLETHTTSRTPLCDLPHIKEEEALQEIKAAIEFDHNYDLLVGSRHSRRRNRKGPKEPLDFRRIHWPKDALYLTYENRFEFMEDEDSKENPPYPCDCCDPAKNKRLLSSGSEEEDSDGEEEEISSIKEEGNIKEEIDSKEDEAKKEVILPSSSSSSSTAKKPTTHKPGWFGKGRRKRIKA